MPGIGTEALRTRQQVANAWGFQSIALEACLEMLVHDRRDCYGAWRDLHRNSPNSNEFLECEICCTPEKALDFLCHVGGCGSGRQNVTFFMYKQAYGIPPFMYICLIVIRTGYLFVYKQCILAAGRIPSSSASLSPWAVLNCGLLKIFLLQFF